MDVDCEHAARPPGTNGERILAGAPKWARGAHCLPSLQMARCQSYPSLFRLSSQVFLGLPSGEDLDALGTAGAISRSPSDRPTPPFGHQHFMTLLSLLLLAQLSVPAHQASPVLAFPEPGLDDSAAYQG